MTGRGRFAQIEEISMAKNADGSVTLKETGKTAFTPTSGNGRGVKAPNARSVSGGAKVTKQPGRSVAPRRSR